MPSRYRLGARCRLMSNVAGEARASVVTSKSRGPPLSRLLVHVARVIRTVPPPSCRRHRPSIEGPAGRAYRFGLGTASAPQGRRKWGLPVRIRGPVLDVQRDGLGNEILVEGGG